MSHHRRMREERGSIPLALMAIIALTAVVGALVATTIGGSRAARFDQQYTEVIQIADAGAQEGAQHLLRVVPVSELEDRPVGYVYRSPDDATLDGVPYTWTATKRSTLVWQVVGSATSPAVGGVAPVTREVSLEVRDRSRFFLAAFSDESFIMSGSNAADSYGMPGSRNGIVASNGTVRLRGMSTTVDGVHLYNFDELPHLDRCDANGGTGCNDVQHVDGPRFPSATFGPRLEVGPNQDLDTQFISAQRARCTDPLTSFTAATSTTIGAAGTATVLCVDNFTVGRAVDLTVLGTVEIYVYGTISIGNQARVNCSGCTSSSQPDSTRLQLYSDGGDVRIGNHTYMAAGIYAPQSTCGGNPSSAQADIFGSLICGEITNQGGWQFHFDDRLAEIGSGSYQLHAWREG